MNDFWTRREFLETAAAGSAMLAAGLTASSALGAEGPSLPKPRPAKIYKVFAGRTGDAYLTHSPEEIIKFNQYFAELQKKLGDVEFIGGDTVPPAKLSELATKLQGADALLIVHLSGHEGDAPSLGKLVDVGLPTVLFSQPFSGHGWMYFPQWHKEGKKVILLPSSNWADLDRVVGLLRAAAWMKQTRILAVGGPHGSAAACSAEQVKKKFGTDLVTISNDVVMEAFKAVDPKAAEAEAQAYWMGPARRSSSPRGRRSSIRHACSWG